MGSNYAHFYVYIETINLNGGSVGFFWALKVWWADMNAQVILTCTEQWTVFNLKSHEGYIIYLFLSAINRTIKKLAYSILWCNKKRSKRDFLAMNGAGREEVNVGSWSQQIWKCFVPLTICLSCLSRAALSLVICLWVPLSSLDCSLMISVTGWGTEKHAIKPSGKSSYSSLIWNWEFFLLLFSPPP